jgi:iron complex outermembrane receptor protein
MSKKLVSLCALFCVLPNAAIADAEQEAKFLRSLSLEDLMKIDIGVGSRGDGHNATQSPVPLEVITAEDIARTGYVELGKVLQRLLPSFNFPRAALADGTDHARPFTLRGMGADQVLVLINGKRRHPGALLHFNATIGRGSTGVDINMIPAQAVARIEVLRDGAAAQYGSDAIAGIINIILKKSLDTEVIVSAGQTREGDGELAHLGFSSGKSLPDNGFVNIHGEIHQRGASNRSGPDRRQQYFDGDPRNQRPPGVTHRLGDAEIDDILLMANLESYQGDREYYANASFGYRHSDATGFFRRPLDNRTVRAIYPDGFLPHIAPRIQDVGLTVGTKSETSGNWLWDASYTLGYNDFNFRVENSLNTSLGADSPTEFDSGSLRFSQHVTNLDAFKALDLGWENPLNVGVGGEFRWENFDIVPGEPNSHIHGGVPVLDGPNAGAQTSAGAQVFPGFKPSNATDAKRHNGSLYLDLEYQVSTELLTQAAARYERYSDFGSAWNGKLAAAYRPNDNWALRVSTSTGFRAPSLAQSHFTSTATAFVGNNTPVDIGTFNVDHPLARALGATGLRPEESKHFSAGLSYKPSRQFLFSLDYFFVRVDDRIVLSGDIYQNPEVYGQAAVDALQQFNVLGARFFSNAIDTETQGMDATLKYEKLLSKGRLNFSAQYHLNNTRIVGDIRAPAILGDNGADIILDRAERIQRIESGQPQDNIILSALYEYRKWAFNLRLQRFGKYQLVNYLSDPSYDQTVSANWLTDLDFNYQVTPRLSLSVGAHNLFDVYPDANLSQADDPYSGAGKIIPYAPNAPFGYNGAFYYMHLKYRF